MFEIKMGQETSVLDDSSNSASEVNFGGVRPYLGLLHNVYICDVDKDVGHDDYGDIDSIETCQECWV